MMVSTGLALQPIKILNRGILATENVGFKVLRDVNLGLYMVLATVEVAPNRVYAGSRPCYWFEARNVKAGDMVLLFTGKGQNTQSPSQDGHTNHFYFWGAGVAMFPGPTSKAVLVEINTWQTIG
ncbi:conserved hypothetical protein [Candidatus Sulfopaludibacter sp. SbA4]|nr:conserved hypothetical protein [Candidatus Sulfopaludibacter sp. SbA4]